MWIAREHTFGGMRGRYVGGARRSVRTFDPFTAELKQFASTLRDDNFLLRNYAPHVTGASVPSKGLEYFWLGKRWHAKCHLLTVFDDGVRVGDLVATAMTARVELEWAELQRVAPLFGIVPKLRTPTEIRGNLTLLRNLDAMRQHLVLHDAEHPAIEEELRIHLPNQGGITAADLQEEIKAFCPEPAIFQACLYRLYRRGLVSLNLAEAPYGNDTIVAHG